MALWRGKAPAMIRTVKDALERIDGANRRRPPRVGSSATPEFTNYVYSATTARSWRTCERHRRPRLALAEGPSKGRRRRTWTWRAMLAARSAAVALLGGAPTCARCASGGKPYLDAHGGHASAVRKCRAALRGGGGDPSAARAAGQFTRDDFNALQRARRRS